MRDENDGWNGHCILTAENRVHTLTLRNIVTRSIKLLNFARTFSVIQYEGHVNIIPQYQ